MDHEPLPAAIVSDASRSVPNACSLSLEACGLRLVPPKPQGAARERARTHK